ncbi:fibrillarin-like rRNA methylase [Desulfurococcaceae archaeon AG1]|jgi:fibrillarin-like pre-rRNA processing protein|nr:MAG: fibrillarin-like rRNA/tRNA 2'-O-methyltransferase [Desulfurococcaceae archaeon]GAY26438.1 fibrillarin-like rRNA methylase [Desulfurococcaceae archaeon AG1]
MSEPVRIYEHPNYKEVYVVEFEDGSARLATKNLVPGKRVYGERLFRQGNVEYREWNAYRSKLAGALLKGLKENPVTRGSRVLYLGAGSGTTPSHVSDIVGMEGIVYAVEFAPRVMRELLVVAEDRGNLIPILGDARMPYKYKNIVETVDLLYADIAQPDQAAIVSENARFFLKDNGYLLMAVKARSIDVTMEPSEVYKREIDILKDNGFEILDVVHLEPFDKDHAMVYAVWRRKA